MELSSDNVKSEQLGASGLIAAAMRELKIMEKIDERLFLNEKKGGIVSYGTRVGAMILNGLGFMNSRLYMAAHYFQDKPASQLLGRPVTAEQLNDDCLGRCLDKIAEYGVTKLYGEMAFEIAHEKGLLGKSFHLDSTSFVLYGQYEKSDEVNGPTPRHGYSKANRHDLKQVMLSLTQNGAANLPLWMEALDGNSSDKSSFHETVRRVTEFVSKLKNAPGNLCFVVDAAFYDAKKLKALDAVNWITRVPATLKECKAWKEMPSSALNFDRIDENYQACTKNITFGGLAQRWVLIHSRHAEKREQKTLEKRIVREHERLEKTLWHLSNQVFNCESDAIILMKNALKNIKYHAVSHEMVAIEQYTKKGRPNKDTPKQIIGYKITCRIAACLEKIEKKREKLGRFVLATNKLDEASLGSKDILAEYKEQSSVESGFKFIKDDAFELDSFFLKTPHRIGALMMIMTLCLMVYNFAQYHIRKCLKDNDDILPNQHGKPAKGPTLKWIAEMMIVIAVVTIRTEAKKARIVTNVNQVHRKIIAYFGKSALKIYGLPEHYQQQAIRFDKYKNFLDWCER